MGSRRQGKRPWLAALLGTLATGLGHFYLRRWRRGLGWFLVAVVTSVFFVPADAARALLSGSGGDPVALLPMFAVGVASVADAYVLARLRQHEVRTRADEPSTGGARPEDREVSTPTSGPGGERDGAPDDSPTAGTCPNCGKDLDPDLDFCPWCTMRLESAE